jgi:hypothetical protein
MRAGVAEVMVAAAWLAGGAASAQDSTTAELFRASPDTYAPRYDPSQQTPSPYPVVPYSVIVDAGAARRPAQRAASAAARQGPAESRGHLSLFVQPLTAQIYVDGFFVGTVEDYGGSPGPLIEAGTHRVELRADGYETATFDVRIVPGDVVMHRGDLVRVGTAPAPAAPISPPGRGAGPTRIFYVIPRCYAGDTPPTPAQLPAGCRAADVRIVSGSGLGDQGSGSATPPRPGGGR